MPAYAELHALSAFSFRRAASQPGELVRRAAELGYTALALTDECSMAGIVRAWEAARECGLKLITGAEFRTTCGLHLVLLATDRAAYTRICRLITTARRRAPKGVYRLERGDLESGLEGVLAIWKPGRSTAPSPAPLRPRRPPPPLRGTSPCTQGEEQEHQFPCAQGEGQEHQFSCAQGEEQENQFSPLLAGGSQRGVLPCCTREQERQLASWLKRCFPGHLWLGATRLLEPGEAEHFDRLEALGRELDIPRLACGDVRMHRRARRALMDVFSALELGRPLAECGLALAANGERHLRRPDVLAGLYPAGWLEETLQVAGRCRFDPGALDYRYPKELAPPPLTPARHLRRLTLEGMTRRWPDGVPDAVRALVARELALIEEMDFAAFFLTVHDVVAFARSRGILCQGRGSAANSAVCYCLGITEVDPSRQQLLFERFISKERNEPPDIDVDFEHERREEVLQYLYDKYGRERAALAATVICYRPRSALKDVGRALGLEPERMNRLTASLAWWDRPESWHERLAACGFDPQGPVCRRLMTLAVELVGFPRHLSQHVGGMVISDEPLHHLVPVENAAMDGRTVIQWDKDDLESLGLLKVDCLALGMLTVLRKTMALVNESRLAEGTGNRLEHIGCDGAFVNGESEIVNRGKDPGFNKRDPAFSIHDSRFTIHEHAAAYASHAASSCDGPTPAPPPRPLALASIPREDPATYDMLCRGDAVGVFQVESRAQMAMLPRLKPRCFYDLVIEVAIVRPGPIQGDMVHPYLERRADPDRVRYPGPELKRVLERTLGVPIFQEQVMQIAIVAAGFSPGEADQLRRAMAAWKRRGGLEPFRDQLVTGMRQRGYSREFAGRIYRQICGFGDYGFPESHAASFALLTYFSAWLKCHHPAAFACGLLNSQPMGFYAPAQIIGDVRRHGVRVLPADVRFSGWDCSLEPEPEPEQKSLNHGKRTAPPVFNRFSIRLGLRMVRSLGAGAAEAIVAARAAGPFRDVQDLAERAGLDRRQVRALAAAGALKALAGHRNRARWQALGARRQGDLLAGAGLVEDSPRLPRPDPRRELLDDYASLGLSLEQHPVRLLRPALGPQVLSARQLAQVPDGRPVQAAGLVTHRQRPGTASGVIFLSLEDETGIVNVIVWPKLVERYRREVLESRLLRVRGRLQNAHGVQHLVAASLHAEDDRLAGLDAPSRDFC